MSNPEDLLPFARAAEKEIEWLELDPFLDVCASLRILEDSLERVSLEPVFWKQALISVHSALQGACVCILTHTDGTGALEKRAQKEIRRYLYGSAHPTDEIPSKPKVEVRLASLEELLKRLPGALKISLPARNQDSYPQDASGDLRRLCNFRNLLTHYPPERWIIEIAGLPRIVSCAVELTGKIVDSDQFICSNRFCDTDASAKCRRIVEILKELQATRA